MSADLKCGLGSDTQPSQTQYHGLVVHRMEACQMSRDKPLIRSVRVTPGIAPQSSTGTVICLINDQGWNNLANSWRFSVLT
jgi:hypothetical protein